MIQGGALTLAVITDTKISPLPMRVIELKVERSKLKLKGLTVTAFGHLPGRRSRRKSALNEYWSFTYIVRGKGSYQIDGQPVQPVRTGSLFWEWPGTAFHFGPDLEEGWDEYYVCFEGSRVKEWLDSGLFNPSSVMQIGSDSKSLHSIETIGSLMDSGIPDNADRAALLVESLVYDFSFKHASRSPFGPSHKPENVLKILDDISTFIYQPWDEQQVWERNHISRSSLRRIVHHNTGYPLNEYVNRLKITEAKKLLTYTTLKIREISTMLGYEDPAYFSRLFHKFVGISAVMFRNRS